jgi:hypothetical protein
MQRVVSVKLPKTEYDHESDIDWRHSDFDALIRCSIVSCSLLVVVLQFDRIRNAKALAEVRKAITDKGP